MAKAKRQQDDKLARYRKKTASQRGSYRPSPWTSSVAEAKEIFKHRYAEIGYRVKSIRRRHWHFTVTFGEDKYGNGLGPGGLKNLLCNWPYINDIETLEGAQEFIQKRDGIKIRKRRRRRA